MRRHDGEKRTAGRRQICERQRELEKVYDNCASSIMNTVSQVLRCWGKTVAGSAQFHPAVHHMLDVGHVAMELLHHPLSLRYHKTLRQAFGVPAEEATCWIAWLVAAHDIGKISAAFQSSNKVQLERLKLEGFTFGEWSPDLAVYHTDVGHAFLRESASLGYVPGSSKLASVWREAVGAHHGLFCPPATAVTRRKVLRAYEPAQWTELRRCALDLLRSHFVPQAVTDWDAITNTSVATLLLAGFTTLCDWIGSDGGHFPADATGDLPSYALRSRERARQAVESMGLVRPVRSDAPKAFQRLFPELASPRPLQLAIDAIPDCVLSQPCLAIIEAPTGEGKTEAALALAHRLAEQAGTDEFYYALPTTATSNQMFLRVQKYMHTNLKLATTAKLVHGQAHLVEDDLRLSLLEDRSGDYDETPDWFAPKKRALLAPFGVGTIDQAELAALNARYSTLRMLGLAGKTLVLDEVHAYDTYMTAIIERLLRWASCIGTSVVLLSATLPRSRRKALMQAFGCEDDSLEEKDPYPSVRIVSGSHAYSASPAASQPKRTIELRFLEIEDSCPGERAEWLLDAVRGGQHACACWITNTVERAQRMYEALLRQAPPDVDCKLLHGRFPLEDRQALEQKVVARYDRNGVRPQRGIVVGTQVLEQSLDLDFDVLVSDLAPIDLVLQRAGRLQRHDRQRPPQHLEPHLYINQPLDAAGVPRLETDRFIYDRFLLLATWHALRTGTSIMLPADYRRLVETVYSHGAPEPGDELWEPWRELQRRTVHALEEANLRLLGEPDPEELFCLAGSDMTFVENETSADWIVAQTRLGEESLNVIPLERRDDGLVTLPGRAPISLTTAPTRAEQLALIRRSLRISHPVVIRWLKGTAATTRWSWDAPLLRNYVPLWLTNGETTVPGDRHAWRVSLSPDLGLCIRREQR